MRAYSVDLRSRIVQAYRHGEGSHRELARRFAVAEETVRDYVHRVREGRGLAPTPHHGGPPPRIDGAARAFLLRYGQVHNDATLAHLCDALAAECAVRVSVTTMCRVLQQLDWRRKKKRARQRA